MKIKWFYYSWIDFYHPNLVSEPLANGEYRISNDLDITHHESEELFLDHIKLLPQIENYTQENLIWYFDTLNI